MKNHKHHCDRHDRAMPAWLVGCALLACASMATGGTVQKIRRMTTEYDSLQSSRTHVETTILNTTAADTYRQEFQKPASRKEFKEMMQGLMQKQPGITVQSFNVSYKGLETKGKPFKFIVSYKEQGQLFSKEKNGAYSRRGRLPPATPNTDEQYALIFPKGMILSHATSGIRGKAPDGRAGLVWKFTKRTMEPYYLELRYPTKGSPIKKPTPPPRVSKPIKKPGPPLKSVKPPVRTKTVTAAGANIGVVQRKGVGLVIDLTYENLAPGTVVRADLVQMPATIVQSIPAVVPATRKAVLEFHPPLLGWAEGHYKIEVWAGNKPLAKREILLRDYSR